MQIQKITQEWLKTKKKYIKESTYAYYKVNIENYIIPYFGDIKVNDLSNSMVQDVINYWQYREDAKGEIMKWSTIKNILSILKQIIFYARNQLNLDVSITEFSVHPIKNNSISTRKVWSSQEQQYIVKAALKENNLRDLGIIIAINCGLRIGEICALTWGDINIKEGVIHVKKTLQRIYSPDTIPRSKVIISTPKTISSIREIPMSKELISYICELKFGKSSNYILTNTENYMEPRTYRKYFKKFLQKNNINFLNFHCLRHSFATRCISNGSDIKVVSDLLGHATVNTTWNMYIHPSMQEKYKCVEIANII